MAPEAESAESLLVDLEARQEDLLRRLDELNERIEKALEVSRPPEMAAADG